MRPSATLLTLEAVQRATGIGLPDIDQVIDAVRVDSIDARASAFLEGERCRRLFVVQRGILKQLYTDENGSEWVKSFAAEGDLFACPIALAGGEATFASTAIEPSIVESVDWAVVEALAERHASWQRAVRVGFQRLAELKVRRERDLLMLTPEQLYRRFATEQPALVDRVPQKELAAFLGVTAVGLNRIIRRVRGEKTYV